MNANILNNIKEIKENFGEEKFSQMEYYRHKYYFYPNWENLSYLVSCKALEKIKVPKVLEILTPEEMAQLATDLVGDDYSSCYFYFEWNKENSFLKKNGMKIIIK